MTIAAAEKICGVVGEVISQSNPKLYDGGSFIRVKVAVDITLPLCRGHLVSLSDGKQVWISFRYERLPNLCYWCGRLTHDDRDFELWIDSEGTLKNDQREFGPSLRAQPFVVSKKNTIFVPGFYSTMKKKNCLDKACQAMEEETAAQPHRPTSAIVSEKGSEMEGRFKKGINLQSMHNGNNAPNTINAVIPIIMQSHNSVLNGLLEESTNAEVVSAEELNTYEVADKELKVGGESVSHEGISKTKTHVITRASPHENHVLPSWTCRSWPGTPTLKTSSTKITGKKREFVNLSDYLELISKRLQISQNSQNVEAPSFILAEADHQPR